MEAELQTYEYQLTQVSEALQVDPGNEELSTLKAELQNLISLTRSLVGGGAESSTSTAAASASAGITPIGGSSKAAQADKKTPAGPSSVVNSETTKTLLNAGDECLAKYKVDNRYYPARITSVGGSKDDPVYSIIFKAYNTSEMVRSSEIKPLKSFSSSHQHSSSSPAPSSSSRVTSSPSPSPAGSSSPSSQPPHPNGGDKKRSSHPVLSAEEAAERERKKKRSEKQHERHENKTQVAQEKASSWQKFASKKKVAKKAGGQGSMFRTPEDPLAKVGVVGAGRGMTSYQDRSKHVYDS